MSKYLVTHKAMEFKDRLTLHCVDSMHKNYAIPISSVCALGESRYKLHVQNAHQSLPVALELLDWGELELGTMQVMSLSSFTRNRVSGNSITVRANHINSELIDEVLEGFEEK